MDTFDELLDSAKTFLADKEYCSTSEIQRRFRLGYNMAARIVDKLEEHGFIGPFEGAKPRRVLKSTKTT